MTEQEALEDLVNRACDCNLNIDIRGENPPGPFMITHVNESGWDGLMQLSKAIGGTAGHGHINPMAHWRAKDDEAALILEKLIPLLLKSKNKTARRKAGYARDVLRFRSKQKRKEDA